MATEKIITANEIKVIEKDGKEWVELIDAEGKTHRIFKSMQKSDDSWCHLEDKVEWLKEDRDKLMGRAFKLTKEQRGNFWNVIGVELVENAFVAEAQKQVEDKSADTKNRAVALSYAKDLAVADKIKGNQIIFEAEMFNQYLNGNITVPEEVLIKYVQGQVKTEMKEA